MRKTLNNVYKHDEPNSEETKENLLIERPRSDMVITVRKACCASQLHEHDQANLELSSYPGKKKDETVIHYKSACKSKVKLDESFVPALEDEAIEVEHLLAEPKNDTVSVDGVFRFDKQNREKCLEIEDHPCRYRRGLKTNSGGLDSNSTQERDGLKIGVFNGMLPEVDEVGNLQATNGLSTACEDYLLDVEFAEKVSELDYAPREASSLENSSWESHSPGFSDSDDSAVGISESSTASIPVPECQNDLLNNITICELHSACRSKCGCQTRMKDKMQLNSPTSVDSMNLDKLENTSNLLASGMFSNDDDKDTISSPGLTSGRTSCTSVNVQYNEVSPIGRGVERESFTRWDVSTKSSFETSKVGTLPTQKRLRKPTKRYIEEVSDVRSGYFKGRRKSNNTSSKDKILGVRSHNEHHRMGFRGLNLASREKPNGGANIQAPFGFLVRRGSPKKHASISRLESDEEPYPDESEDDSMTTIRSESSDRRKHQRLWTLSEVIKLVDGVSHYGVGRWTDIKRLLFSSSAYRTPVDLRDKWRNLLRASCAQLQNDGEDEQKRKHASRPLPISVLHRVSELASIYPYPRERNSKLSRAGHASIPSTVKGTPLSLGRRAIPR